MVSESTPPPLVRQRCFLALAAFVFLTRLAFWLLTDHVLDGEENFRILFAIEPEPWRYSMIGPLHLMLLKIMISLFDHPLLVGPLVTFLCSFGVFWLGTALAWRLYHDEKAAAATALFLGFGPIFLRYSTLAKVEPIYTFALMLCLWFLTSHPRRVGHLLAAAGALAAATALRFESWALVPILTAVIWLRPRDMSRWLAALVFGLPAVVFPIIWLVLRYFLDGNPLDSYQLISEAGVASFSWSEWTRTFFPAATFAFLAAAGLGAVTRRPRWPVAFGVLLMVLVLVPVVRFGLPSYDMKYMFAPLAFLSLAAGAGVAWLGDRARPRVIKHAVAVLMLVFLVESFAGFHRAMNEQQVPENAPAVLDYVRRAPGECTVVVNSIANRYRSYFEVLARGGCRFVEPNTPSAAAAMFTLGLDKGLGMDCPASTSAVPFLPWYLCEKPAAP
ncbi:MAG: hypothetical protein P9L99_04620 [Candidatus Lernaella stagnicola]|nr:hypothetical protein [Candidatus Lernaella stagnicola]